VAAQGRLQGRAATLLLCALAINQYFKERWQNKNSLNLSLSFRAVVALHITFASKKSLADLPTTFY